MLVHVVIVVVVVELGLAPALVLNFEPAAVVPVDFVVDFDLVVVSVIVEFGYPVEFGFQ